MKTNHFAKIMALAITASIFFACSDSSPNGPSDNPNPGGNGITDDSQVYIFQCYESTYSCSLDSLYTGSGTIKGTFLSGDGEQVLGTMDMGTVSNGKINLEFRIPEEEFYEKGFEFRLYNNDVLI